MNARSRVSLDGRGHEAQKGAFRGTQAPVDARDYRNRWSRRGYDRELAHPPRFSRVSARALSSNYEPSSAAAAATTRAARPRAGSVRAFQRSHVDSRCLWAPPTPRLSVIPRLSRCVPLIHGIRAALSGSSSRHAEPCIHHHHHHLTRRRQIEGERGESRRHHAGMLTRAAAAAAAAAAATFGRRLLVSRVCKGRRSE